MASFLADEVLDFGVNYIDVETTDLHILSDLPVTWANVGTMTLGNKAAPVVSAPQDGVTNGRRVTVSAITDGDVTGTGTASHWALVDTAATKLLAASTLASSQAVTSGNTFTLTAFDVTIPDPA